jgi:hypothetical protein
MQSRRDFLAIGTAAFAAAASATPATRAAQTDDGLRGALAPYVLKPETVDRFLDPGAPMWAYFHPTYGYLLRDAFVRDGVDGSYTLARYEPTGQRMQINFRGSACRINTYGDSFTQGHQVSDGETWQEVLAAHFCEPIRNFGVGGFGVYQAARRLMEVEPTDLVAEYLIFNIWGDDHFRSIYSWRWLAFPPEVIRSMSGHMFHANPWVHARLDPQTGELVDRENVCPDPESLRKLCDLDFVVDTFGKDDVSVAMLASRTGVVADASGRDPIERLDQIAAMLGDVPTDWSTPESVRESARRLLHRYGVEVGKKTIRRVDEFARMRGKKLMVLLSYPVGSVWHACNGTPGFNSTDNIDWHPQDFKDLLVELGIPYVDSVRAHVDEYRTFKLSAKEYVDRYYIGHYTPRGNHFFAYATKDPVRDWLKPAPPVYRANEDPLIRFEGYLPQ